MAKLNLEELKNIKNESDKLIQEKKIREQQIIEERKLQEKQEEEKIKAIFRPIIEDVKQIFISIADSYKNNHIQYIKEENVPLSLEECRYSDKLLIDVNLDKNIFQYNIKKLIDNKYSSIIMRTIDIQELFTIVNAQHYLRYCISCIQDYVPELIVDSDLHNYIESGLDYCDYDFKQGFIKFGIYTSVTALNNCKNDIDKINAIYKSNKKQFFKTLFTKLEECINSDDVIESINENYKWQLAIREDENERPEFGLRIDCDIADDCKSITYTVSQWECFDIHTNSIYDFLTYTYEVKNELEESYLYNSELSNIYDNYIDPILDEFCKNNSIRLEYHNGNMRIYELYLKI